MPATPTVELRKDRVRQLREEADLSRLEIAQLMGYSISLVCKIENGYAPSPTAAWWLAKALRVHPEDITVGGVPVPEPVHNPLYITRARVPAMSP
jgi:transcriptional regulator with XRE-family HTH domain